MPRTTFFAIAAAALPLLSWSPPSASPTALKNPLQLRVTSVGDDPVSFTVIRQQGFIAIIDGPRPADTVHSATPRELRGSGGESVFVADNQERIKIEAWRMFGQTRHVVAEGQRITVTAPMADGIPELVVAQNPSPKPEIVAAPLVPMRGQTTDTPAQIISKALAAALSADSTIRFADGRRDQTESVLARGGYMVFGGVAALRGNIIIDVRLLGPDRRGYVFVDSLEAVDSASVSAAQAIAQRVARRIIARVDSSRRR